MYSGSRPTSHEHSLLEMPARGTDVPRRAELAAVHVELDLSLHTPFVCDGKRLALAPIRRLRSSVGSPMRSMTLLPGAGEGELASDAIALAAGHCTIVTSDSGRPGGRDKPGAFTPAMRQVVASFKNCLCREPPLLGLPMAYFRRRVIGVEPFIR
jgi:hypothetical protein